MNQRKTNIKRKYRYLAPIYDLVGPSLGLRRIAVQHLGLCAGDWVMELGFGTGLNLPLLVEAVGQSGQVVGVELSPHMFTRAQKRVKKAGWNNVHLILSDAEEVALNGEFDALLLFFVHDLLTSSLALDNALSYLKDDARIVAVGGKILHNPRKQFLHTLLRLWFRPFSVSRQDMEQPWRLLERRINDTHIEEYASGAVYLVQGQGKKH